MSQPSQETIDGILSGPFDEVKQALRSSDAVPRLTLKISAPAGEYWATHPGALNVRWWWLLIEQQCGEIHDTLVEAWALYIHSQSYERLFDEILAKVPLDRADATALRLSAYQASVQRRLSDVLEAAAVALYALRERIGSLAYEIARLAGDVAYIQPTRIGYNAVLREMERLLGGVHTDQIPGIHKALGWLRLADVQDLVEHRNISTHRLRVRAHEESFPLFLEVEAGRWDSVTMGTLHPRRLLHLSDRSFHLALSCLEDLAAIKTNADIFSIEVNVQRPESHRWLSVPHGGLRVGTPIGELQLTCTKQCHGLVGTLVFDKLLDPTDKKRLKKLDAAVTKAMKQVLPEWESERSGSTFTYLVADNGSECKVFILKDKERRETVSEQFSRDLAQQLLEDQSRGATETWVGEDDPRFKGVVPPGWPSDALALLHKLFRGNGERAVVVRPDTGSEAKVHLALRSRRPAKLPTPLQLDSADSADVLFVFNCALPVEPK